ncbi:MAG: hypothetical protein WCG10_05575 [Chlamydiota bacterium]
MSNQLSVSSIDVLANLKANTSTDHKVEMEIPLTFKNFTEIYQWPSMGSLRKLAYEAEFNGLSKAFIKFKKRRLVLPTTLFSLLKGSH